MLWQKEGEATRSPKNRDQRSKKLLLKYKALHLWSVPLVFFMSYSTYFISATDFYHTIYPYVSEIYGYSLYTCTMLFVVAKLFDACLWHFASIGGMATHNVLNMAFASDPYEIAHPSVFASLSLWVAIVVCLIWKEEVKVAH